MTSSIHPRSNKPSVFGVIWTAVRVPIARLRFLIILGAIGLVISQWDSFLAELDKRSGPAAADATNEGVEFFCPMHPSIIRDNSKDKCPICFMPLSKRKKGEAAQAEALPAGTVSRVQLSPYRVVLAGVDTWRVDYVPLIARSSPQDSSNSTSAHRRPSPRVSMVASTSCS